MYSFTTFLLSPSLREISNTESQWIPELNLANQDLLNIWNNEETDDFIILQGIHFLQIQYPTITTQPQFLHFQHVKTTARAQLYKSHILEHITGFYFHPCI